jgi:hypothetical protein
VTKAETEARLAQLETAALRLLAMMDRQHGSSPFSENVKDARTNLRAFFKEVPTPRDLAERVA